MSFAINKKLIFIDSFQFLNSSSDSLVKTLTLEFDANVLDLVKEKVFFPCGYISNFEKFKEEFPSKEKFYSSLIGRKISDKEYEHVLNVWNKFEMKKVKNYHGLNLKCGVLLLVDVFEKFRSNRLKNYGLCPSH